MRQIEKLDAPLFTPLHIFPQGSKQGTQPKFFPNWQNFHIAEVLFCHMPWNCFISISKYSVHCYWLHPPVICLINIYWESIMCWMLSKNNNKNNSKETISAINRTEKLDNYRRVCECLGKKQAYVGKRVSEVRE